MKNEKLVYLLGALLGWFALVSQFSLIHQHRVASAFETTVRFFTFFTILTNLMVAIFFSGQLLSPANRFRQWLSGAGIYTALTIYILVVGLVYQVLLRHIWNPTGLQMWTDELLHTVIPIYMVVCWIVFDEKKQLSYRLIPAWLLYPGIYCIVVMIRGAFTGYYPYPFLDVATLGFHQVILTILGLILLFVLLSLLFIWIGRKMAAAKR